MSEIHPKPYRLTLRAVIPNDRGEVLFLQRSAASKNQPGYWELPGGKIDAGENLSEGLIREVREETGLIVELDNVLCSAEWFDAAFRIAYLIFSASIVSGAFAVSHEHDDFIWLSPAEALERLKISPQLEDAVRQLL